MQFLHMKEDVGYEEFLATVYVAETKGSEGKVVNVKAKALTVGKITDNKEQSKLKDLRQQIESLAAIIKSATVGNVKPKVTGGVFSPRKKGVLGTFPWKGFQGSPIKGKGPLKLGERPIKSYRCDGWSHGWKECPALENLNWRELVGAVVPSTPGSTGSTPTQTPNQNP